MTMHLTSEEMETTIRWDRAEKVAHIWTCDPTTKNRLDKMVARFPETYKVARADQNGIWYECPADRVRFFAPVSEAKRQQGRINGNSHGFARRIEREIKPNAADPTND